MCGIAGIVGPQSPEWIETLCRLEAHRGPDGQGLYRDPSERLSLGHRRLSIIDLEGGAQPMENEDGSIRIVFNGEIYNAPELRPGLERRGHRFRTRNSDTEVLLHLYEEHSFGMLSRLSGMFAFALHDAGRNLLFCARDRLGIKPFYYARKDGRFAFASELGALAALPFVSAAIDLQSLYHYVGLQFTPAPDTMLADVKKLPAGHSLVLRLADLDVSTRRYWDLRFAPDRDTPAEDWPERVRRAMDQAVRRWSVSDVPIACSLSGGLDSSVIVGMLASAASAPVHTYSLGFSGEDGVRYGETGLARLTAEKWGTVHNEIIIEPGQVLKDLEAMVRRLDEPYGGGLPSWYVFAGIGRDCKVAMTGTGGDELFGNYGKWAPFEGGPFGRWRAALAQQKRFGLAGRFRDARRFPHGHFYHRYLADAAKDAVVFRPEVLREVRVRTEALLEQRFRAAGSASPRDAVAFVDVAFQLPEEFLLMTDRFSMAHGVEARTPLLDHELMELVFTIPPEIRTKPVDYKYLMRETVRPYLAEALLTAPKKGFVLPLPEWTRGPLRPLVEAFLSPQALKAGNIFSTTVWTRIVLPHLQRKADHTPQVWTLLLFQLWRHAMAGPHAH